MLIRSFGLVLFISWSLLAAADEDSSVLTIPPDKIPHTTDSLSIELSANFQSRHVWRGSLTCSAWNIQPTFNVSRSNFLVGAWAAYTIDNSYAEVDLYASYTVGKFTVSILDYFCPDETKRFNRFFDFKQSSTQHTLDLVLSYNGGARFPFNLSVSSLIWGDDLNPDTGANYFSTYIEAGYSWRRTEQQTFDFSLGISPFKGYYAESFSLVSIGASVTQDIMISDKFVLPTFGKIILNPYTENLFFVFGVTIGIAN